VEEGAEGHVLRVAERALQRGCIGDDVVTIRLPVSALGASRDDVDDFSHDMHAKDHPRAGHGILRLLRARPPCDNPAAVTHHPVIKWTFDPAILLALALWTGVFVWRCRAARREAGGRGAGWRQGLAFAGCMLVLLIALVSPIDALGEDYLFSMHMTQHILLGDIAPLLLLLSLSRVIMRPATRRLQSVERRLGRLASPVTFIVVWLALLYFWHIPALYDAAIEHPLVHALEHACFFAAGVAVWWPLIQPVPMRRRLTGLATFGYIGTAKVGLAALGLFLTWSSTVAYTYYEHVPRIWGLSAVEDQNVGGAIMMVEQSLVLVTVFTILFVRMLLQSEEDERRRERLEDAAAV
jgi:putative membrane protein